MCDDPTPIDEARPSAALLRYGTSVRTGLDVEAILNDLYASEINAAISWLCDGGIDVKLGDPLNGYDAEGKVGTFAEAARVAEGSGLPALPG
jgi:hypothetical protein